MEALLAFPSLTGLRTLCDGCVNHDERKVPSSSTVSRSWLLEPQTRKSYQGLAPSRAAVRPQAQSLNHTPVVVSFSRRNCAAVADNARGIRCGGGSGEKVGSFRRLGRVIKENAKSEIDRLFSGFSKTRENVFGVDELLTHWNLSDSQTVLEELEEAVLVADFGPRTTLKIVDELRKDILAGKLKTGPEIKKELKSNIIGLLTKTDDDRLLCLTGLRTLCNGCVHHNECKVSSSSTVAVLQRGCRRSIGTEFTAATRNWKSGGIVSGGWYRGMPGRDRLQAETHTVRYRRRGILTARAIGGEGGNQSTFLSYEEAGLIEMSKLDMHERFLCRLTVSSLNLLRVISEQEGVPVEELNAGRICDWFQKDKVKREEDIGSATLKWDSGPGW